MELNIKMLGDKLLVEKIITKKEEKSPGGIYLPQQAKSQERMIWSKVLVAGKDAKDVVVGNNIYFDVLAAVDATIDGIDYLIVREQDILGFKDA